ncbi:MAG TPA: hypothetical protein VF678_15295 [bacterium]
MESPYLNNLLHYVSEDRRYNMELAEAKDEFQQFAGPIFETDRNFDARINSFHNWYIIDRPLKAVGKTPLQYFLEFNANSLRPEELQGYRELGDNVHSLFDLLKVTPEQSTLRDVFTRQKYTVEGAEQTRHLDKRALFNTRLFTHGGQMFFANYVILHPADVTKEILVQAKKVRKSGESTKPFLYQLLLFQSRWDQYKQMDIRNIYRFES